jgi:hypothetical protein
MEHHEKRSFEEGLSMSERSSIESRRLFSVRKCPVCGTELEKVYVNAPRGVLWFKKKPRVHLTTIFDSRLIVRVPLWHAFDLPALKCKNCNFIAFIGTSQPWQTATPESFLKNCVSCGKAIPIASDYCPRCGAKQS